MKIVIIESYSYCSKTITVALQRDKNETQIYSTLTKNMFKPYFFTILTNL